MAKINAVMGRKAAQKTSLKLIAMVSVISVLVIAFLRQTQNPIMYLDNASLLRASTVVEGEDAPKIETAFKLPNLLLAGVQKCGTTAVDNYLREQDLVCSALEMKDPDFKYTSSKELHFFDIKERYSKGVEFYRKHFEHCNFERDHKFLIDSTPNYQQHAERIYRTYKKHDPEGLKNLKIIFTVREPVQREMSWFNHWSNSNRWQAQYLKSGYQPSFQQDYFPELAQKRKRNDLKGLYYHWFQKWFQLFDRQQILVVAYDEIKHHPQRAMQRVHEFLNVPVPETNLQEQAGGQKKIAGAGVIVNTKQVEAPSCDAQKKLLEWFRDDTERFYQLLHDKPGPPMEQRPFPKFEFSCYQTPGGFANTTIPTRP